MSEYEPVTPVPQFLRTTSPRMSELIVIDERVPLAPLVKALADGGFTLINDRTGKLVITQCPEDFRPSADKS